jgi:hypothetical protein
MRHRVIKYETSALMQFGNSIGWSGFSSAVRRQPQ